jgi:hypothetical protein
LRVPGKSSWLGDGGKAVTGIKVLLRESHIAWAAFEGPV